MSTVHPWAKEKTLKGGKTQPQRLQDITREAGIGMVKGEFARVEDGPVKPDSDQPK